MKMKKQQKILLLIIMILQIIFSLYIGFVLFRSILIGDVIKIIAIVSLLLFDVGLYLMIKRNMKIKKKMPLIITYVATFLMDIILFIGITIFAGVGNVIDNITGDKYMNVTSNFVVLKESKIEELNDLKGKTIGLLTTKSDYEGYILPKKALDESNLKVTIKYGTTYLDLINKLLNKEYDAIALPDDYQDRFEYSEDISSQFKDFKIIHTMKDKIKIVKKTEKKIEVGKPFNIVLIGTDSALETHHHNYDVIILLTFNPETKDLAVTSVYRAVGMYSKCIGGFDLVTHNGWKGWGSDCLKQTVEDFFDIDISYYLMIDFSGFVDLVDEIGGIHVNVPKSFCEQNSERKWGKNTICLNAGEQDLNGEQALAFARHRKSYLGAGGEIRSQNHITVIKAIANKIISSGNLFQLNKLLEIIQNNMETDISKEQLSTLFNMGTTVVKEINYDIDKINIIPLSMKGYGEMLYSPAMNTVVGLSLIYQKSYDTIYNTLHTVIDYKPQKPTYYSIDLRKDPNEIPEVYLKGIEKQAVDPRIMPNLIGKTDYDVSSFVRQYLYLTVTRKYQYSTIAPKGTVISQSIPAGVGMNHAFHFTVTISLGSNETAFDLPNTSGWDYKDVISYINSKKLTNYTIKKYTPDSGEDYEHNEFVKFDSTTKSNGSLYPSSPVTFYIAYIPEDVKDIEPTLTLKGDSTIEVILGGTYQEPGFTAFDETDWYITNKVTKSGTVDTNTLGSYEITYSVTNSNGLTTTKTRTIIVI